jgi:hypothetical protein
MFGSYNMWSLSERIVPPKSMQIERTSTIYHQLFWHVLTCFDHVGVSRHLETHPLHHFWLHTWLSCYIPLHPIIVIFWLNNLIPHDFVAGWIPLFFWLDLNFSESAESPFNHNHSWQNYLNIPFLIQSFLAKLLQHPSTSHFYWWNLVNFLISWRNPTKNSLNVPPHPWGPGSQQQIHPPPEGGSPRKPADLMDIWYDMYMIWTWYGNNMWYCNIWMIFLSRLLPWFKKLYITVIYGWYFFKGFYHD